MSVEIRWQVINVTSGAVLADRAELAHSFWRRFLGLMGRRKPLTRGEGLVITPCNSIHMFFMHFPLDVVFTDRKGKVVGLCYGIVPGAVSSIFHKAHQAIELPIGVLGATGIKIGDLVEMHDKTGPEQPRE